MSAMSGSASASSVLCFDIFQLDLRAGELRKQGVKLRLQGQPLQVLAVLLRRAGDVVSREELRMELWPADTFVDFDHSLHNAIARIREAIGDSAQLPRYIETLPRRGYRFMGDVVEVPLQQTKGSEPIAEPAEYLEASETSKWREEIGEKRSARDVWRRVVLPKLALASAVLFAAGVIFAFGPALLPPDTGPKVRSIAVLPLENLSGDPSQECFVDGMTEELITDLAKDRSLRVISRTSVMRYKGTKKGLPEIARELKVDGVVEGSVLHSGKRVRVTAQLLHAPTDQHLWAETYEREFSDELTLQRDLAQAIAQQVRARVESQKSERSQPREFVSTFDRHSKPHFHEAPIAGENLNTSAPNCEARLASRTLPIWLIRASLSGQVVCAKQDDGGVTNPD
jgi:TolB-like protein/DNA-binding winged helix-turn-helix (wHTH) protein